MYKNIIEDINEPMLEGMVKPREITHFFKLDKESEKIVRDTGYKFGFGLLSDSVFNRTYSRKDNGYSETFPDVIVRVVNGIMSIRKDHYINHGFSWNDEEWKDFAINVGVTMMKMQCLPPGRGLYVCGTPFSYKRGGSAFNNCGFTSTKGGLVHAATWMMDSSMCGCGVGFDTELSKDTKFYFNGCKECRLSQNVKCNCDKDLYVIHDSREGWVKSVNLLLKSYTLENKNVIHFDYSKLREKGAKIVGFGGVSSGPEPLEKLHSSIRGYFECYENSKICPFDAAIELSIHEKIWGYEENIKVIQKLKEKYDLLVEEKYILEETIGTFSLKQISSPKVIELKERLEVIDKIDLPSCEKTYGITRLIVDIFNAIGVCVVAGNVRRSSEIALGRSSDVEFRMLKNVSLNPERQGISYMSNNSVSMNELDDFKTIPDIAEQIKVNGEPGILNHLNLGTYGRIGKKNKIGRESDFDNATGINPCLTADTLINTTNGLSFIKDLVDKKFEIVVEGKYAKSDNRGFWSNGVKEIFEMKLENGMKVRATENHKFMSGKDWIDLGELKTGNSVKLSFSDFMDFNIKDTDYYEGYICGEKFSSGSMNEGKNVLPISVNSNENSCVSLYKEKLLNATSLEEAVSIYFKGKTENNTFPSSVTCPFFENVWNKYNCDNDIYMTASQSFNIGFLKSIFDKKSECLSIQNKVLSVSLTRMSLFHLERIQQLFSSINVNTSIIELKKDNYILKIKDLEVIKLKQIIGYSSPVEKRNIEFFLSTNQYILKPNYESKVISILKCGEEEVFDCSIPGLNRFSASGILSHNCGEIPLEDLEYCNLSEVFLERSETLEEKLNAIRVATFYASTVSLLPTHWSGTNKVVSRNRRIGVGLGGIATYYDKFGLTNLTTLLKRLYLEVRTENKRLALEAGVCESIRVTTVKPSGSVSLLTASSNGVHFPTFQRAIRNVRFAANSEISDKLIKAGVYWEEDVYDKNTRVFSFPISYGDTRAATDVSIWEQASILKTVQRNYSDNSVSVTLYFDPKNESNCVANVIADTIPYVKSLSVLPHVAEGVYAQSPFVKSTDEEYQKLSKDIKEIDWKDTTEQGELPKGCESGLCELAEFKSLVSNKKEEKSDNKFFITFTTEKSDNNKKRKASEDTEDEEDDIPKPKPLTYSDRSPQVEKSCSSM
jgi:ribonucleotide reductase alpha subunit